MPKTSKRAKNFTMKRMKDYAGNPADISYQPIYKIWLFINEGKVGYVRTVDRFGPMMTRRSELAKIFSDSEELEDVLISAVEEWNAKSVRLEMDLNITYFRDDEMDRND